MRSPNKKFTYPNLTSMQLLDQPLTTAEANRISALAALRKLLAAHDPVLVAQLLESEFNALPSLDRGGYRVGVSLMSQDFQGGGFDA